jgi:hypothetical protein
MDCSKYTHALGPLTTICEVQTVYLDHKLYGRAQRAGLR